MEKKSCVSVLTGNHRLVNHINNVYECVLLPQCHDFKLKIWKVLFFFQIPLFFDLSKYVLDLFLADFILLVLSPILFHFSVIGQDY